MPYIKKESKEQLKLDIVPMNAGELNYVITKLMNYYIKHVKKESYQAYNDCLGALEGAKLELYRRKIAPYEDKKIKENGDVY